MPTIDLSPTIELLVDQADPDTAFHGQGALLVGGVVDKNPVSWPGSPSITDGVCRSWLKFNLATLAGATINSATLTLYGYFSSGGGYEEFTVDVARSTTAITTSTTWNNAPNGSVGSVIDSVDMFYYEEGNYNSYKGEYAFDVASAVAAALSSGSITLRLKMSGETDDRCYVAFMCSDYSPTPSNPPILTIDYTPGEPDPGDGGGGGGSPSGGFLVDKGPCDCCSTGTADCDSETVCCSNGEWPETISVAYTGCDPGCYCPGGPYKESKTLTKFTESPCTVGYSNAEDEFICDDEERGSISYGFSATHHCDTHITEVCAYQFTGGLKLCWSDSFSDPNGTLYCAKAFEIPWDPFCNPVGPCAGLGGTASSLCDCGPALVG